MEVWVAVLEAERHPLVEANPIARKIRPTIPGVGGDGPDGRQAYLVRSRFEASLIQLHRMSWDGHTLLDPVGVELATGSGFAGPKLYQRNGYYYIFTPQGAISSGEQAVLRASAIDGPYERRVLLEQGSTDVAGPHGGAWVDLPSGEAWFFYNQQAGGWGRLVHLQPASWSSDDWPSIGVDWDENGVGEPVRDVDLPDVGTVAPPGVPASSDEFSSTELGLQWMWNHNPDPSAWSLSERPGWLRLRAQPLASSSGETALGEAVPFSEDSLLFAYDTLVQRAMGQASTGQALLDTSGMVEGQRAGLALFGKQSAWVGVALTDGIRRVAGQVDGTWFEGPELEGERIHLQARVTTTVDAVVAYSLDGATYTVIGNPLHTTRSYYQGVKYALFTYLPSTSAPGGAADFDYFRLAHDGPRQR
jgi:beta-xylosidase